MKGLCPPFLEVQALGAHFFDLHPTAAWRTERLDGSQYGRRCPVAGSCIGLASQFMHDPQRCCGPTALAQESEGRVVVHALGGNQAPVLGGDFKHRAGAVIEFV